MNSSDPIWDTLAPLSDQTVLATYVLECRPEVLSLTKEAELLLSKLRSGRDGSFDAYVSGNPRQVRLQVRALYETLYARGLTYRVEDPGSLPPRQKVRLPDVVLSKSREHGCCIDLVLLLASALQNVGLHPLIVVVGDTSGPNHAILGYWTEEFAVTTSAGVPVPVLEWSQLQPHLAKVQFVECTDLTVKGPTSGRRRAPVGKRRATARVRDRLTAAVRDARTKLPPIAGCEVKYVVDVQACRGLGIGPVPADETTRLLTTYLEWVTSDCAGLKLAAVGEDTVSSDKRPLRLDQVYVDLDLDFALPEGQPFRAHLESLASTHTGGAGQAARSEGATERETRRVPLLEALAELPTMVLLGAPGAGKSTFVAYVALCLAQARLGRASLRQNLGEWWEHGPLIPVRVTLRKFAAALPAAGGKIGAKVLWDFIRSDLEGAGLPAGTRDAIQKTVQASGGLFLLDGLDEARDAGARLGVLEAVVEFAKTAGVRSRFLLTSRPYGWQDIEDQLKHLPALAETLQSQFSRWRLGDFGPDQIKAFVGRWFEAVRAAGWMNEPDAREQASNLQEATRRDEYSRLAHTPLLLTLMATLLASRKRLPEDRTDLYDAVVELLLRRWNQAIGLDRGLLAALNIHSLKLSDVRQAMESVAFGAHAAHVGSPDVADIAEATITAELRPWLEDSADKAEIVLDYVERRAALLLGQGTRKGLRQYTFPHRTIQEFLAACHLANQPDYTDQAARLARQEPWHWREVLRFAARRAGPSRGLPAADGLVHHQDVERWRRRTPSAELTERDWECVVLAGEQLLEIGMASVKRQDRDGVIRERIAGWLAALVHEGHLPVLNRATAGMVLGILGDPRPGVGLRPDGLPDIDWIELPAGLFVMGDARQPVNIPQPYRISRYPVTVGQYGAFVKAGGYGEGGRKYWTEAGWAWKTQQNIQGPTDYEAVYQTANHPRVGVSWYEAVAFCRWLSQQLGILVRLPSEAEWERAARHTDGREYPWGNEAKEARRCNLDDTGIGHTSAVGMFPSGAAECGAMDLAGNVWEWCRTKYEHPADDELEGDELRVLRGGSWDYLRENARCASRYDLAPVYRRVIVGFRVVVSPSGSDL